MLSATTTQFCYRAAPVFAAPPCPNVPGIDCVALGPVAVDDDGLRELRTSSATEQRAIAEALNASTQSEAMFALCSFHWESNMP
jgi:hypothetical protein